MRTHVRAEFEVASTTFDVLVVRVVEVTVNNLFGQGEWTLEPERTMRTGSKMNEVRNRDLSRTTAR